MQLSGGGDGDNKVNIKINEAGAKDGAKRGKKEDFMFFDK